MNEEQSDVDLIARIEEKIAFLERANSELGDVVYAQQRQIETLQARLEQLAGRLEAQRESEQTYSLEQERPPHY